MKVMETTTKPNVFNTLNFHNTVGQELCEICAVHGINNPESVLQIKNLSQKETLSDKQLEKICTLLRIVSLKDSLKTFQENYARIKEACKNSYIEAKKQFTQVKSVLPLLNGEFNNGKDVLDDILDFFGLDSVEDLIKDSNEVAALYRKQNDTSVDPINLKAWLRRGELDFEKIKLSVYSKDALQNWLDNREWELNIQNVEYFTNLPNIFKNFGVALVFVPFLPHTVYGAVRWINGFPLVEISDRNKDLATCWFTLFHELGHVLLHENIDIYEGEINEKKNKVDKCEKEANKFANSYLFNGDDLRKTVFDRKRNNVIMSYSGLAKEFEVDELFSSYWLRKAQYLPTFQRQIQIDFSSNYSI